MYPKGTIAIEEAVLNPDGIELHAETATLYAPGATLEQIREHPLTKKLLDIHTERLAKMDAHGVDYMLLSLTSAGVQAEPDRVKAEATASRVNDWLASEAAKKPTRFGALAAVPMHDGEAAAKELRRAVKELGMFGGIINDYQEVTREDGIDRIYYDTPDFDPFWAVVEELGAPIYLHPRYPAPADLPVGAKYGPNRRQLLGAGVQFHLDLSFHVYAICSAGVFDRFPGAQIVLGHLGEGIPFNLWRADHWINKPMKKKTRPAKQDYTYYFKHNVSITTSGDFSTQGLKFCIDEIGVERCLFSIDYPYDTVEEAQEWWKTVDLPEDQKNAVARGNAIRLFKLPLEP